MAVGLFEDMDAVEGKKRCTNCGDVHPVSQYNKSRFNKDGLGSYCRLCKQIVKFSTRYRLKAQFTIWDYRAMLARQGGVCRACKQLPKDGVFDIDHCHDTGVVCALLCHGCNAGIAFLRHDPVTAEGVCRYLWDRKTVRLQPV